MAILVLENHPSQMALAGPLLVDSIGIPRYCATIWSDVILAGLAPNTRIRHLYAVDRFYRAVNSNMDGDLDHMLMTADFEAIESALLSFHTALRNEAKIKKTSNDAAWKSCYRFINDMLSYLGVRTEIRARELDTRLRRVRRLYGQLSPSPPKPPLPIRALPSQVVKELCEIFDPTHRRNPFRSERERWRNHLIFLLLLHTGLRRSELAMLPSDAVSSSYDTKAGKDRHWINVGRHPYLDKDPRREKPSLKTRYSSRQLPISEDLVTIVDIVRAYKKKGSLHPFIFGSQKGKPLHLRSFQRILEVATDSLSEGAKKVLGDRGTDAVTAHSLRHTCAVYRLSRYVDGGDDLDLACEKLRAFFGWSPTSPMPRHYGRAYFEAAAADDWHKNYDNLVSALRRFDGVSL